RQLNRRGRCLRLSAGQRLSDRFPTNRPGSCPPLPERPFARWRPMNLMPASATDAFPVLRPSSRFVATHLWIPLAAVLALSALLTAGGVDQWLATQIYHAEGGHWLLKDHWFTAKLVHRGGKQASTAAALALLVFGLY